MQFKPTRTTLKTTSGTAVVAGDMPTATTGLRGLSRVYRNHRTTPFLGFVLNKGFELGKRPRVDTATGFGFALDLRALPNIGQVFQHNRRTTLGSRHDLLTQDVIVISPKARLLAPHSFQVALGRLRALLLQRASSETADLQPLSRPAGPKSGWCS